MKGIWILLLLYSIHLSGQTVTGKIVDGNTRMPVEYAAAYINGTTNGVMSDQNGEFLLPGVNFPCEIVISHVSYNPFVLYLERSPESDLTISISPKIIEINEITVVNDNLRRNNIQRFRMGLLGTDKWGEEAILLNDSVLRFYVEYYGDSVQEEYLEGQTRIFQVNASAPLKIELPLLGYDLQYDLVNYVEKYNPILERNVINILGYSYYKPKMATSIREEKRYRRNRMKTYFYSVQHFTRSLYNNKLKENGYHVFYRSPGFEKPVYNEFILDSCDCITYTSQEAMITGFKGTEFVMSYYANMKGYPEDITIHPEPISQPLFSMFYISNDSCIIRKDGSRPGHSIIFGKGISTKRIGAALPNDYIPEYQ